MNCKKCGKRLLTNINWPFYHKERGIQWCRICWNRYNRERQRRFHICGRRSLYKGEKRPYPSDHKCELCQEYAKKLDYHHYDDEDLSKGFWTCLHCHTFVERLENEKIMKRYLELKKLLEV